MVVKQNDNTSERSHLRPLCSVVFSFCYCSVGFMMTYKIPQLACLLLIASNLDTWRQRTNYLLGSVVSMRVAKSLLFWNVSDVDSLRHHLFRRHSQIRL